MGKWFLLKFEVVVFRRPVLLSYGINGRDDLLEIERVVGREAMRPIEENRSIRKNRVVDGLK